MNADRCLICGQKAVTGLNILGCTICFPCEKKLIASRCAPRRRRRLIHLYRPSTANA
ncbi:MAG: hypothetical protein IKH30_20535 [Clostridia bacterium]|nr:hypothetical protein [Clostridia bacterium]